ncbi:hypothetical protein P7K49_028575 [Saguinus oedipus]|uniref:Uncharacterized protein n=1 Tax=Saguinus oedipus TaxID=9490 RepID=A0ABQ9U6Q7_SAGOE|nr:hypothetical protein P7K49_028575 [Saguinus oedipus]
MLTEEKMYNVGSKGEISGIGGSSYNRLGLDHEVDWGKDKSTLLAMVLLRGSQQPIKSVMNLDPIKSDIQIERVSLGKEDGDM